MATTSFSTGGGTGSNGLGAPTAGSYAADGSQISFGTGDPAAFSSQQQQLQNAYGWTPEQYASWASNPTNASQVVSNNNWAALQASQSPSQTVAAKPATAGSGLAGAIDSTSSTAQPMTGASGGFTVGGGGTASNNSIIGSVTNGVSGYPASSGTGTTTNGATGIATPTAGSVTDWSVNPNQTVAGQIANLTDPNQPLIAQARAQALQAMNARGLPNSSLAQTAADSAAYQVALPIAQQDASTNATAAQTNANAANTLNVANLQAGTSVYTAQTQAQTQALNNQSAQQIAEANNQSAQQIAAANNQSQQLISKMSSDTQVQVQKLQNDYGTLINSSSQAANSFNTAMQTIANINASTTMDANTKTQAIAQVYNNLQQQFQMQSSVSGLGVSTSLTNSLANSPGFDSTGKYVGFNADGTTKGSTATATGSTGSTGAATGTTANTQ
jgi:vacuolar-type H+-ATPase subunit H